MKSLRDEICLAAGDGGGFHRATFKKIFYFFKIPIICNTFVTPSVLKLLHKNHFEEKKHGTNKKKFKIIVHCSAGFGWGFYASDRVRAVVW